MRHYSFTSFYLSSIQQGIQGAHGLMELFLKYPELFPKDGIARDHLYEWAKNHKTMICLNGGMAMDLDLLEKFFNVKENLYPWSVFCESEVALEGIMTNVSIVLPERIYETSDFYRRHKDKDNFFEDPALKITNFSDWEKELVVMLSSFGLAR